ncbi:MAG: hypothetical protein DRO99_00560 [Candidatus Aenigmatarchaeota archaeon]|nr:MAG: hypothetical protein DRO99_00560 [Candidatus Aenigmarchaeota archaeon]
MLIVVALIALHVLSSKYVKRRAMRFANYEAMEKFTGDRILSGNYMTLALRVITLLLVVLAMSGMTVWYMGHSSDSDYVLAIDASGSMMAEDFQPNRLSAAKTAAKTFLDTVPEDTRIGIVSFAGISFIKQEMTNDMEKLKKGVDRIDIETVGGTAVGDAIVASVNLLANSGKPKVVILLTDGQNNVGITLEEAVDYASEEGVVVDTIGIGTEQGGQVGEGFVSKLDSSGLRYVANRTGGMFYSVSNVEELAGVYEGIATSEERLISYNASTLLLLAAIAVFFIEWMLTNTRWSLLP